MHIVWQRQQLQSTMEQTIKSLFIHSLLLPLLVQTMWVVPLHHHVEPLLVQALYVDMSFCCPLSPHMMHLIRDSLLSMHWLHFLNVSSSDVALDVHYSVVKHLHHIKGNLS